MPGLAKVPEEPQLPEHAVLRQQPRGDAIQERTQECMIEVMADVPETQGFESPGGALSGQDTWCQGRNPGGMRFMSGLKNRIN